MSLLFRLEGFQTAFSMDVDGFLAAMERRVPDIAVINLRIGAESGVELLRRLRITHPGLPVFMLSDTPDVDAAVRAMKAGARDVLTRPIDTDHLLGEVDQALLDADSLAAPAGAARLEDVRGFALLTPREREVLQLITSGESNKEAGRRLGISPRTIEVHRARVMEKLGARNTADLMRIILTG